MWAERQEDLAGEETECRTHRLLVYIFLGNIQQCAWAGRCDTHSIFRQVKDDGAVHMRTVGPLVCPLPAIIILEFLLVFNCTQVCLVLAKYYGYVE